MEKRKFIFDMTRLEAGLQRFAELAYQTEVPILRVHEAPDIWTELIAGIRFEMGEVMTDPDGVQQCVIQVVPVGDISISPRLRAALDEGLALIKAMEATGAGTDTVN